MDDATRLELRFVARYEPTNKVWGWLTLPHEQGKRPAHAYAWWAVVGKTISFKRHSIYGSFQRQHAMTMLEDAKLENKYVRITEEELLDMWPDFHDALANRFLFMQLSNGFER